jgi:signal transduction histidine kinase
MERDKSGWFVCKNGQIKSCQSYEEALAVAKDTEVSVKMPEVKINPLIVVVILCLIEAVFIFVILSSKFAKHLSKKDKKLIFRIQEEERTKLSLDIHDSVVQNIRAIRLEAEMLEVGQGQESKKQKIVDEMTEVITLLRNICYNFRPAELSVKTDNVELISIIDTLCQQFIVRTKIPCNIQIQKDFVPPKMDTEKCTNIVRAVQEALSNIEKHSYATGVKIVIKTMEENLNEKNSGSPKVFLVIFIIDDGIGCDVSKLGRNKMHFGIRNMKERIAAAGGEIEFFSTPGEGLSVQMRVPYER